MASLWDFFVKSGTEAATCTMCCARLMRRCGSTSGMRRHLQVKHPDAFQLILLAPAKLPRRPRDQPAPLGNIVPTLKWPDDSERSRKLDWRLAEMMTLDDQPCSIVNRVGFRRVLEEAAPRYQVKPDAFYAEEALRVHDRLRVKVKDVLDAAQFVCLTAGLVCEGADCILSVRAHFVDKRFERKELLLAVERSEGLVTAEAVAVALEKVLFAWNLQSKVFLLVHDVPSTLPAAGDRPNLELALCAAQKLQRVTAEALQHHPAAQEDEPVLSLFQGMTEKLRRRGESISFVLPMLTMLRRDLLEKLAASPTPRPLLNQLLAGLESHFSAERHSKWHLMAAALDCRFKLEFFGQEGPSRLEMFALLTAELRQLAMDGPEGLEAAAEDLSGPSVSNSSLTESVTDHLERLHALLASRKGSSGHWEMDVAKALDEVSTFFTLEVTPLAAEPLQFWKFQVQSSLLARLVLKLFGALPAAPDDQEMLRCKWPDIESPDTVERHLFVKSNLPVVPP